MAAKQGFSAGTRLQAPVIWSRSLLNTILARAASPAQPIPVAIGPRWLPGDLAFRVRSAVVDTRKRTGRFRPTLAIPANNRGDGHNLDPMTKLPA